MPEEENRLVLGRDLLNTGDQVFRIGSVNTIVNDKMLFADIKGLGKVLRSGFGPDRRACYNDIRSDLELHELPRHEGSIAMPTFVKRSFNVRHLGIFPA